MQDGNTPPGRRMDGAATLGTGTAGESPVKDTTTAAFAADVVRESHDRPVLVDFWAPWCGPCKQLAPVLERLVGERRGAVRLVKLNIDDHPAIPGQMGIQSIPAVFAFAGGKPVDAFMGALPESELRRFIDKVLREHGGAASPDALIEEARAAALSGDATRAAEMFAAVLKDRPGNLKAMAGMAECMIAAGDADRARALLGGLTDQQKKAPEVAGLLARFALEDEVAALGDAAGLEARLAADPGDHAARFDLAKIRNARGEREMAADDLLAIMKADRTWRDDGARKQLLIFFEAWGPADMATVAARRKLSSLMFS